MVPETTTKVTLVGVDEAVKKAEQLVKLLKEARTLAGELASSLGDLRLELDV